MAGDDGGDTIIRNDAIGIGYRTHFGSYAADRRRCIYICLYKIRDVACIVFRDQCLCLVGVSCFILENDFRQRSTRCQEPHIKKTA